MDRSEHRFNVIFNNQRLVENIRQEAKLTSDQRLGQTQQDFPSLSVMVGDGISAVDNRLNIFVGGVTESCDLLPLTLLVFTNPTF